MDRLPVSRETLLSDSPALPPDAVRHLRALRAKPGDAVELFDGAGLTRLFEVAPGGALRAAGPVRGFPRPAAAISLYACVSKGSRWDWTIEKTVELGVGRIVPVVSARTIVRLDSAAERAAKAERWRRVALDAARQSGAVWLPQVEMPLDFSGALADAKSRGGTVFAGVISDPPAPPLVEAWGTARAHAGGSPCGVSAFVGPEGDFTPGETAALAEAGAIPVSLGPTVLRTETAAIYMVSVLAAFCAARNTPPALRATSPVPEGQPAGASTPHPGRGVSGGGGA